MVGWLNIERIWEEGIVFEPCLPGGTEKNHEGFVTEDRECLD
jgi:hypothetical protein